MCVHCGPRTTADRQKTHAHIYTDIHPEWQVDKQKRVMVVKLVELWILIIASDESSIENNYCTIINTLSEINKSLSRWRKRVNDPFIMEQGGLINQSRKKNCARRPYLLLTRECLVHLTRNALDGCSRAIESWFFPKSHSGKIRYRTAMKSSGNSWTPALRTVGL